MTPAKAAQTAHNERWENNEWYTEEQQIENDFQAIKAAEAMRKRLREITRGK